MKRKDRYDVSGLPEAEFQPGSRGKVLRNRLGITSKTKMDQVEALSLEKATDSFFRHFKHWHKFTAADVRWMRREWLGRIYEWAGQYRSVNMSKGGFLFAGAAQIPKLMDELERGALKRGTPCSFKDVDRVVGIMAEVHTELVLIHPFREGNGRLARVMSGLMAFQAGRILSFGKISEEKEAYFAAVRDGLKRD